MIDTHVRAVARGIERNGILVECAKKFRERIAKLIGFLDVGGRLLHALSDEVLGGRKKIVSGDGHRNVIKHLQDHQGSTPSVRQIDLER